jgi:hypothetical protein
MYIRLKVASPRIAAAVIGVFFCLSFSSVEGQSPSIIITNLPAYGAQGNLGGLVVNANPAANSVAVYIYVSEAWYSKPNCAGALTPIQPDGSWTANITTSGSDPSATEIAAFLVPTNYSTACVNGATGLPIPSQAEAVVYATRVNPSTRQFNFSGYGWAVRNTTAPSGPGPNYFSNRTNNVWLDAQGQLHMKITQTNGVWECAEVTSDRSFGYGQYRFTVSAPVNSLDPNVVLGLFTYSNDNVYNYREVDVELSRWENAADVNDAQFVIQPAGTGQKLRFSVPDGITNSTYSFTWQSNNVAFQSLNGNFASPPASTNILKSWNCTAGIPPQGGEQVHINLWLDHGDPPANGQPVEVIISNFEFVPLGSPQPAQLSQLTPLPDGNVQLNVQGLADWRYQIFSSSDLVNWLEIGTILATNSSIAYSSLPALFQFIDTNPVSLDSSFYRTVTEP